MRLGDEIRCRLWEKQEASLTPRLLVWFLDKWMHDISTNCRTNFYKLGGLKQYPFIVSVGKESGFMLAGSFAQGLTTWKLRNHPGQQYHLRLGVPFSAHSVLAEFSFLWLSNQDAQFLTDCWPGTSVNSRGQPWVFAMWLSLQHSVLTLQGQQEKPGFCFLSLLILYSIGSGPLRVLFLLISSKSTD